MYAFRYSTILDTLTKSTIFLPWAILRNDFCTRAEEGLLVREFVSSQISRHTHGRNQTPFSPFIAISFLSEESLIPSSRVIERKREVAGRGRREGEGERNSLHINHMFFLFIVVQKCAPYTQIKFVPGVRSTCVTNFTGEDVGLLLLPLFSF